MATSSAVIVGPWGDYNGGDAFDDGWNNGGVRKLTIYYGCILTGIEVAYGNGTTKVHGSTKGSGLSHQTIDFSSSGTATATAISIVVGRDSVFSNDIGVVALGAIASDAPTSFPTSQNGHNFFPQIVGFFGGSSDYVYRLGLYLSNPAMS